MSEERGSEKRFKAVMDKLFHPPNPSKSTLSNNNNNNNNIRGIKRPNTALYLCELTARPRGGLVEALSNASMARGPGQAPLCRPWDRRDLMNRLATFKSMTWFAKPQVVNAVNCARRGWINIDADTIACESCGARLFFSTPSSWMQHQVEKAALVFSLKLDNGHKLLCPWIDNSCDETLAQFPPAQAETLVDEYKKRFFALMLLLALPVISSSAISRMNSPLLKQFLGESSDVGCSDKSGDVHCPEDLGNNSEMISSRSYHQAQKLISLCGWEPRSLPYTVDCKNRQNRSNGDAGFSSLSRGASNERSSSLVVYSSGKEFTIGASNVAMATEKCDPSSVVLDCRLCGASVGLWAFSTVPQPLESLRIVGKVAGAQDDFANLEESAIAGESGTSGANDVASASHQENRQSPSCSASTSAMQSTDRGSSLNLTIAGGPPPTTQNFKATIALPVIGRNLRARLSSDPDFRDRQCLKNAFVEGVRHEERAITGTNTQMEDTGLSRDKQVDDGTESSTLVSVVEEPLLNAPSLVDGSSKDDKRPENADNITTTGNTSQAGECSMAATYVDLTVVNGKNIEGNDSMTVEANISNKAPVPVTAIVPVESQDGSGTAPLAKDAAQPIKRGEILGQLPSGEGMEFDPIGQHRPFCPWIATASNSLPGWQQVLSALHRQHEFSYPSGTTDAPSSSLIEVDDPITSIRKLFSPPSAKRTKLVHDSS